MLSQTAEYALRAVVYLAQHPGEPTTVDQIAKHTQVPVGYLAKILQQLARAGLTTAQRGLHGGHILTRPPAQITLLDPVMAVDPIHRIDRCPLNISGHGQELCPLHRSLDSVIAAVARSLQAVTVESLLKETSGTAPLCGCGEETARSAMSRDAASSTGGSSRT
jgi:Rrf2 family transcriptional regulator, nitric oxide-sensitive transcriptional repressor